MAEIIPPSGLTKDETMSHLLENKDDVGMDHIVALGDASASLGLISTLVFSIAISNLIAYDFEPTFASNVCVLALVGASATSSFVISFAVLEYYYAQMLKSKDNLYLALSDASAKRAQLKQIADHGMINVKGLRATSRNCMWFSMVLLQIAGSARVADISENGTHVFVVTMLTFAGATLGLINNVHVFRTEFKNATWY